MKEITELLALAAKDLFDLTVEPELTRPEAQFGDYASNLALQLSKPLKKAPRQVADELKNYLQAHPSQAIAQVEVAGPGFLNITLTDHALWEGVKPQVPQVFGGKKVLLEYSCPNAFKELHVGHLYQTIVGDTLGRLLEASGATVFRANFGGDVGLHVAKALYGMRQILGGEHPEKMLAIAKDERPQWLSKAYVTGAKAYEDGETAKADINKLNNTVYAFHQTDDHDSPLAQLYWTGREWSYEYFKTFYEQLDVAAFDEYYPESQTTSYGLQMVQDNLGSVFVESEGATIFKGEDYGVHTRVFVTSKNLPTYETKDLGVIVKEAEDFAYDRRVVLTGNDQSEYMQVVFAALLQIDEGLSLKQTHLANGTIRFGSGKKMSSRLGNVLSASDAISTVQKTVEAATPELRQEISLGALKYAFLKQRLGGDINFEVEESVSLQGNSGPYLQYAYARACSILKKAAAGQAVDEVDPNIKLEAGERLLARALTLYPETVGLATQEFHPHHISTYLYELAQEFNRFYEHNKVVGDKRQALRVRLVEAYVATLKHGLDLLNIPTPEHL
jgi:arginyl-tRNA synthetase